MRFFTDNGSWNWVDENNTYLGFEVDGDCCSIHGWYLTDTVPVEEPGRECEQPEFDWAPWRFDATFEARIDNADWLDEGGGAVFKIVNGDQVKYLTIYNNHNGYYGSGFTFAVGGVPARTEEVL